MGEEEKFLHSFCFTFHLNKLWLCISGEVCKNLWFSLGPITGELLPHLSCCSRNTAAEVWAAVAELKLLAATEREEVVRAHISLALQEIDNIVRQLFTPDTSLDKKIVVLDINN